MRTTARPTTRSRTRHLGLLLPAAALSLAGIVSLASPASASTVPDPVPFTVAVPGAVGTTLIVDPIGY